MTKDNLSTQIKGTKTQFVKSKIKGQTDYLIKEETVTRPIEFITNK
jgi:hypothetical protein